MELHDGFIIGIYNFCDRWCETCPFTARCRTFATHAELLASSDPNLKPVIDAAPLPEDVPPPPPRWMQELIDEMHEAAREPVTNDDLEWLEPKIPPAHQAIQDRARAYGLRAWRWLADRGMERHDPTDPAAVVSWFGTLIPAKVHRAIYSLASRTEDDAEPGDEQGTAKLVLIGLERSHAAWLALVERGDVSMSDAAPFVPDLVWLGEEIERVFPDARAFIRPGFDEPDEVAKLGADDGA